MKVVVGSKNPVKIEAVRTAFDLIFPDQLWEVSGVEVKSGVSDQPMSERESIQGAFNRAQGALISDFQPDFAVGLEGGLQEIDGNWFSCGWIVVLSKEGKKGIGATINIQAPAVMMKMILEGKELGEVTDALFKKENSKQAEGYFGHMTNRAITRTKGYSDGVIAALAAFINPQLF